MQAQLRRSILNIQKFWTAFKDFKDFKQLDIYCKKLEIYPDSPDYLNFRPDKTSRLMEIEHSNINLPNQHSNKLKLKKLFSNAERMHF